MAARPMTTGTRRGAAFDWTVFPVGAWLPGVSCGPGVVGATGTNPRTGDFSVEWGPIGWSPGDNDSVCAGGNPDKNASFVFIGMIPPQDEFGRDASSATFTAWVNTDQLAAGDAVTCLFVSAGLGIAPLNGVAVGAAAGDVPGWQQIQLNVPIGAADEIVVVIIEVDGSVGDGSPGSVVFMDDFCLSYNTADGLGLPLMGLLGLALLAGAVGTTGTIVIRRRRK